MEFDILKNLNSTDKIKAMSFSQLHDLCDQLRQALIFNVSNTGGHLASNLGVVELTVAIHKVFDSPNDQIVFDVGHQCYVHKMLTGRFNEFSTLRKKVGISGFPNPQESEHDIFKTGHSSTSISSALGLAYANSLSGKESSTVVVIGDGSITGGLAYEGLNNAGNSGKSLIVILNDNEMSISKNVGSIAKALTKLRNKPSYFKTKDFFSRALTKNACIGQPIYRWLVKLKSAVKAYFYSSNIFEHMGFKYFGPIDGHNIELVTSVLERAKSIKCPVLVHVKTKKGKGYSFAENKPGKFHGIGEFDVKTGASNSSSVETFTDVFGNTLCDLAKSNDKICAITAAMGDSCGLKTFKKLYPDRFFDVGIAEQHSVTFAGGLAKNGMLPVVAIYSTFLQRSYDQIIHDVSLQNAKVIFAIDRAGLVGSDGETHQGLFDVPMLLPVPNIKIYSPADGSDLKQVLIKAVNCETSSVAIRYPKANSVSKSSPFESGLDYQFIENGQKSVVVSYGREIFDVVEAVTDINTDILKLNLINDFSNELIQKLKNYSKIIFVEECFAVGGVGHLLSFKLTQSGYSGSFYSISLENEYVKHCEQYQAKEMFGLDSKSLYSKIDRIINKQ